MSQELPKLIAEVLEAESKATPAPWTAETLGGKKRHAPVQGPEERIADCFADLRESDANLIAFYRTAAPLLARKLQKALAVVTEARSTWSEFTNDSEVSFSQSKGLDQLGETLAAFDAPEPTKS